MKPAASQFKRPESILVVVFTQMGEVLLLKRADHADFWQSVTGSLDWHEDPQTAAERELLEETGLRGHVVDRQHHIEFDIIEQWRHRYAPGTSRNREHWFSLELATAQPITPNPDEHTEWQWLPRQQAAEKAWSWSNRQAILAFVPGVDSNNP